ncbi:MAG: acyltransferase [Sandaracinaceae bacterium]
MERDPSQGATKPADVFVHEKGLCESEDVGAGTRVWAFAHVMRGAKVGERCNVGGHAFVEAGAVVGDRVTIKNGVMIWDKVVVEDDVFLGPAMIFTNDMNPRAAFKKDASEFLPTRVGRGASIGANATIVCGTTIGTNAFVAAGAVVIRDVPPHAVVAGNPAERIAWMCECGGRLEGELSCADCGRRYVTRGDGLELAR